MTTPELGGLLMWGQEGVYTAADDRIVITALTAGRTGIMRAAVLGAGMGLAVTVGGGWLAVAPAGDGTSAIAGTVQPGEIYAQPGDAAGTRTDYVWVDIFPEAGRWQVGIVPAADTEDRAGIRLGTVVVPAGATTSAEMAITADPVNFTAGALGPEGPQGIPGPQGVPGPQGPQGEQGAGVIILGELNDPSELPPDGNPGEAWLINGDLWVWVGA